MITKTKIKETYIRLLQETYPFYEEGSRPLALAKQTTDDALSGRCWLKGDCWIRALSENGLSPHITPRALAALPE